MQKTVRSNIQALQIGGPLTPSKYGVRDDERINVLKGDMKWWSYISKIPRQKILIGVTFFIILGVININVGAILLLSSIPFLLFRYNEMKHTKTELKMAELYPTPQYFYIDDEFIHVFHDLRELENFSQRSYREALYDSDMFLHQIVIMEGMVGGNGRGGLNQRTCNEYIKIMKEKRRNVLNLLFSIHHAMDIGYENAGRAINDAISRLNKRFIHHLRAATYTCNIMRKSIGWPKMEEVGGLNYALDENFDENFDWY